ncbi:MAG: glutathione peroxidase [Bacteroidales bacterium]|jgi:glutathione peroxidase|nr:glutathione peroxidase [Bacteroidales bacterium]
MQQTIYDFVVKDNQNKDFSFEQLRDKVLLIVNTASKCGFTPQYKDLEALYKKYKDKGLVVIGFPCDQFGHQEPGTDTDILTFCEVNFGVTFPLMKKIKVNGKEAIPLYKFLKKKTGNFLFSGIKWNFTKFLVSRDGKTIKRYAPTAKPDSFENEIIKLLKTR